MYYTDTFPLSIDHVRNGLLQLLDDLFNARQWLTYKRKEVCLALTLGPEEDGESEQRC